MKTLQNYIVDDRLYASDTGPEAAVGDQVKLFLDQEANPAFPEFILGVIQHPIVRVNCESSTSYVIEYDEADLLGAASLIRPGDVIDATVMNGSDVLSAAIAAETAARIAADALKAPSTGISPSAIVGTAMTLSGEQEILSQKSFSGSVIFNSNVTFGDGSSFNMGPDIAEMFRSAIGISTFADIAAANAALTAGQVYYDIELGTLNAATA